MWKKIVNWYNYIRYRHLYFNNVFDVANYSHVKLKSRFLRIKLNEVCSVDVKSVEPTHRITNWFSNNPNASYAETLQAMWYPFAMPTTQWTDILPHYVLWLLKTPFMDLSLHEIKTQYPQVYNERNPTNTTNDLLFSLVMYLTCDVTVREYWLNEYVRNMSVNHHTVFRRTLASLVLYKLQNSIGLRSIQIEKE